MARILRNPSGINLNLLLMVGVGYLAYTRGWLSSLGLGPKTSGSSSGSGGATGPCPFITGRRYVDRRPDGRFGLVWAGSVVNIFNTQSEAEAAYNALARDRGCDSGK